MPHKHKGSPIGSGGSGILISGGLYSLIGDGGRNGLLIVIDGRGIAAHLTQQRLGDSNALKLILVGVDSLAHLIVLRAVHQMRRLDDQILDAVGHGTVQRLLHVVDLLAVTGLHMVDDDLGGKGAANAPIGVCGLQGILNALDVRRTAAVEGGAEADDQQLILTDVICVAGIIQRSITGIAAEVVGVGVLALHHLLLGVGQGIPRSLGGLALGIGVLGAGLHIDRIDQVGTILGSHLVCIPFLCALGGGGLAYGHALGRAVSGGGAAAAGQQCGGQGCRHQRGGGFLTVAFSHGFCFLSKTAIAEEAAHTQTSPNKKRGLLRAEWQHKKTSAFKQVPCGTTNSS